MIDLRRLFGFAPELDDEDEWERGPDVAEPEERIGQVYERAPAPRWTRVPPTQPGLYLVKVRGGPRRVLDVETGRDGRLVASWTDIPAFIVRADPELRWSNRPIEECA